jgi:hypothetical protein
MLRRILALGLACAAPAVLAQLATPDPDWKELEAPPPPALRLERLVAIDVPGTALRFAVDPNSVTLAADGVVRYVVVATGSGGAVNAMYEGLRCNTAEVKVYARHNPDSGWVQVRDAQWQAVHAVPNSRHSLHIARNGACVGHGPNGNAAQIVRDLKSGPDRRFVN